MVYNVNRDYPVKNAVSKGQTVIIYIGANDIQ